jgi:membrane-associated phospholipid phosphatase
MAFWKHLYGPRRPVAAALVISLALTCIIPASAQEPTPAADPAPQTPAAAEPDSKPRPEPEKPEVAVHRLSIERTLIQRLISDQKDIWTSPFHTSRPDAKWWLIIGASTAALVPADHWLAVQLPNTQDQMRFGRYFSNLGGPLLTYGIAGGFYFGGKVSGNPRAFETGILGAEALTNAVVLVTAIKAITQRERPDQNNGHGRFFVGGSSFPSGHEIMSWSLATIVASEYSEIKIVPIAAYGLATLVGASRFTARKHFASDVVAGAGMGWFIGRHIYNRWGTEPKNGPHPKLAALVPRIEPQMGFGGYGAALRWGR